MVKKETIVITPMGNAAKPLRGDSADNCNFILQMITDLPLSDQLGVAIAIMIDAAERQPEVFRRVMNEKIIREGFTGISAWEHFRRFCK